MKISTTLLAFFLLFAFISHLPSATVAFLADTDGNILRNGGRYYILPALRGTGGGGIERAATGNETRPLTVVQSPSELSRGLPLTISSQARIGFLHEGLPICFSFTVTGGCFPTPTDWTIAKGLPEGPAVKLVGYGNTARGSFGIRRSGLDGYKLVFCPLPSGTCSNIGIYIDDEGNRRLVLTNDNKLVVVFEKVSSDSA